LSYRRMSSGKPSLKVFSIISGFPFSTSGGRVKFLEKMSFFGKFSEKGDFLTIFYQKTVPPHMTKTFFRL